MTETLTNPPGRPRAAVSELNKFADTLDALRESRETLLGWMPRRDTTWREYEAFFARIGVKVYSPDAARSFGVGVATVDAAIIADRVATKLELAFRGFASALNADAEQRDYLTPASFGADGAAAVSIYGRALLLGYTHYKDSPPWLAALARELPDARTIAAPSAGKSPSIILGPPGTYAVSVAALRAG